MGLFGGVERCCACLRQRLKNTLRARRSRGREFFKCAECLRENRPASPIHARLWRREYWRANAEHLQRERRRRYKEQRDRIAAREKASRIRRRDQDPEAFRAQRRVKKKRYKIAHPEPTPACREMFRRAKRARRARKRGAITKPIPPNFLALAIAAFGGCAYCGCALDGSGKTTDLDHFVPLSRGGAHAPYNLVPACKRCNTRKSARDPFEFLHDLGTDFTRYNRSLDKSALLCLIDAAPLEAG